MSDENNWQRKVIPSVKSIKGAASAGVHNVQWTLALHCSNQSRDSAVFLMMIGVD